MVFPLIFELLPYVTVHTCTCNVYCTHIHIVYMYTVYLHMRTCPSTAPRLQKSTHWTCPMAAAVCGDVHEAFLQLPPLLHCCAHAARPPPHIHPAGPHSDQDTQHRSRRRATEITNPAQFSSVQECHCLLGTVWRHTARLGFCCMISIVYTYMLYVHVNVHVRVVNVLHPANKHHIIRVHVHDLIQHVHNRFKSCGAKN